MVEKYEKRINIQYLNFICMYYRHHISMFININANTYFLFHDKGHMLYKVSATSVRMNVG